MPIYRFRAECIPDPDALVEALPAGELVQCVGTLDPYGPECCIEVQTLTLEQMRKACRAVEDGHVMLQTIQAPENYTGKRDYQLH